jgi:hypothetical protein
VFSGVFRFFLVSGKSFFIVAVTKSFRGRVFVFFFLFPVTATLFFLFCEERESFFTFFPHLVFPFLHLCTYMYVCTSALRPLWESRNIKNPFFLFPPLVG